MTAAHALAIYGEEPLAERTAQAIATQALDAGVCGISLLERAWLAVGVHTFQGAIANAADVMRTIANAMVDEAIDRAARNQLHGVAALAALAPMGASLAATNRARMLNHLARTLAALRRRPRPFLWALPQSDVAAPASVDVKLAARALSPFPPLDRTERLNWVSCVYRLGSRERADRVLSRFEASATSARRVSRRRKHHRVARTQNEVERVFAEPGAYLILDPISSCHSGGGTINRDGRKLRLAAANFSMSLTVDFGRPPAAYCRAC